MQSFAVEDDGGPKHPNSEYRDYFSGNVDDCFVLGVSAIWE